MSGQSLARQTFRRLVSRSKARLPLAEAALCIAWEDQQGGDPRGALARLDAIAEALRPLVAGLQAPDRIVAALNQYLFDELGFYGNPECYDRPDPRDSFLDQVLERRTGLPILLSLIYLEVGWRLGLPLHGLGLPGHFIVAYHGPGESLYIDPYDHGRLWSYEECLRQIETFHGQTSPAELAELMAPTPRRLILARMLRNLKNTYLARREFAPAMAACDRLLMLIPDDPAELRDRGLLRYRLGRLSAALEDLERYAALAPQALDLYDLRAFAHMLLDQLVPTN